MARHKHRRDRSDSLAVAQALRDYLAAENLSQKEVAEQLQTSQSTVSRILSNKHFPDPELRRRVARLIGAEQTSFVGSDIWINAVVAAAKSHPDFATLIAFGLRHLHLDE